MEKIKILQLVEDLSVGGAEKVIAEISQGLNKQNFNVSIWCLSKGGAIAVELQEKGAAVNILGISNYFNPLNIFKLVFLLKKAQPNIVHTHGYFASVIGRIAAKLACIPVLISHVHSTYWDYTKRNLWIEKYLSRFTSSIICCSKAVKDFVTGHERIDPSKTTVIYNGVDVERFYNFNDIPAAKKEFGIEPNIPVVGIVSSLTPHKGHKFLLQAAPLILETFPTTIFLFVGDGILMDELYKQAKDLNISTNVIFSGTRNNIPEILNAMDIFVLPSTTREGLGISILEAMATEKPVVATNIGGIPEVVVNGKTGILVPPQNPEALASAIIDLLKNPEKVQEMGKMGKLRVEEKFTTKKMISEIDSLYRDLLNEKRESR